ncbi:hypothetical protein D3C87_77670 [compost metagenome]
MNISLRIGKPVNKKKPPINIYEVKVAIMHGDGDHYNDINFQSKNEEEIIQFIDLFDRMIKEYPHGRGGGDNYDHLDNFEKLTKESWPWDITSDDTHASIQGYDVFYYNELGIKHQVEVKRG